MLNILNFVPPESIHMWFTLLLIFGAMIFYAIDKIPLELTSIIIVSCLLLFFHFFPSPNISTSDIFSGFANSALISVICLLVVG